MLVFIGLFLLFALMTSPIDRVTQSYLNRRGIRYHRNRFDGEIEIDD